MPYIEQDFRDRLNIPIHDLSNSLAAIYRSHGLNALLGCLNYAVTTVLCRAWIKCGLAPIHYPSIAMLSGILDNVKQEFYRRLFGGYEQFKSSLNDLPEWDVMLHGECDGRQAGSR